MRPLVQGYDELRLNIDRLNGRAYHALGRTESGEGSTTFELPFGELEVENFMLKVSRPHGRRRVDTSAIGDARRFGEGLFNALFSGEVHELYDNTLTHARSQGRGVRITLCLSAAPELIGVPWEYLFDDPDFLAVSAFTPIVRYLDLPRGHAPVPVQPPLRLLGIVSSPADYEQLDVERERRNLELAVGGLREHGLLELEWLEQPTLSSLLKALQKQPFHALHYIGHGSYDRDLERGVLLFEDESGWGRPISGDKLGMILHDFASLQLVVLNACEGGRTARTDPFAGVSGSLVRRDLPAVVAMQFEITDEAAVVFAGGFYDSLAGGSPVDASVAAARLAMFADRSDDIEWGTPVLFMRVPDGRLFDLEATKLTPPTRTSGSRSASDGPHIFVNYRRDDTAGHAMLLSERLTQHFGPEHVHFGADGHSGTDEIGRTESTAVLLTLIGPAWAETLKTAVRGRRVEDFARREVERRLREFPELVVPVLIDSRMPDPEALPRSLRGLCRQETSELRHVSFEQDCAALIERIERVTSSAPDQPQPGPIDVRDPIKLESPSRTRSRAAAGIVQPYHDHLVDVIDGMLDGSVVPLIGSGVGGASCGRDQLATSLAEQFDASSSGLAEVAQRVAVTLGERRLYTAIRELVGAQTTPTEVDLFLAEFPALVRELGLPSPPQLIISANYDSGLERAFEAANEPFDYAVYVASTGWFVHVPWGEDAAGPTATPILEPRRYVEFPIGDDGHLERTIIVKIHGSVDGREGEVAWRNNYVVTEDHYIDYLPTHNIQDHLPIQILDKLTGSRCLFLGYVLRNWNSRVFLRRIWKGNPISENSWAVEQDPDVLEKASWGAVGHVELLATSFPDYVDALRTTLADWRGSR